MITAYTTAAESQTHLADKADWLALDNATQDTWLSWGRVYIDTEFSCISDSTGEAYDETNATEDIKQANSLLGYLAFTNVLFADAPKVEEISVAAGSVSNSKKYSAGYIEENPMHKQAVMLLGFDCVGKTGQTYLKRA